MGEKSDKVKYESGHLKNYIKIQIELWINIFPASGIGKRNNR